MALDYKTLQRLAASETDDTDGYCPECGRPWKESTRSSARATASLPWRGVLLVAVGLVLTIALGIRMAGTYRTEAEIWSKLAWLRLDCVDGAGSALSCSSGAETQAQRQAEDRLVRQADETKLVRDRAIVAIALGLLALSVGLWTLERFRHPTTSRPHTVSILTIVWQAGEILLTLTCLLILALYLDIIVIELTLGVPLTPELLDRAADGATVLLSLVVGV